MKSRKCEDLKKKIKEFDTKIGLMSTLRYEAKRSLSLALYLQNLKKEKTQLYDEDGNKLFIVGIKGEKLLANSMDNLTTMESYEIDPDCVRTGEDLDEEINKREERESL